MIVPSIRGRSLLTRSILAGAAGSIGMAIGWALTRGEMPIARWFLPVITLASALLFAIELVRTGSRRSLWAICLCGLVAARAIYGLVRFSMGR